ncbi:hypothetical protein TWF281_001111 [Arthrobotrys megalospora]
MSLRQAILRTGRRSLTGPQVLVPRSSLRHYIVDSRVESTFKHPNPNRDSNAPPPRSSNIEDDWLLLIKRRITKCLTYGTTPGEQETAAQILKQLNEENSWRNYLDRYPSTSTDLAFGLRDFRPSSVEDFDSKIWSPEETGLLQIWPSNIWVDYVIDKSIKVWLANIKDHVWEDQSEAVDSELNDEWLDHFDLVNRRSSYRIKPELDDKFSVLHKVFLCYPYELKIASTLISEKHRFAVGRSIHDYQWRDDLDEPSITNPFAPDSPGKFPEYVVSMLDKYFLHQKRYNHPNNRQGIEEAVAALEECYQRPEDMGSASKPAAST